MADEICFQRIKTRLNNDSGNVRTDDLSDQAIQQRLDVYHESHPPLEDYFRQAGILNQIDGKPSIADVHQSIRKILGLPQEGWHEVKE